MTGRGCIVSILLLAAAIWALRVLPPLEPPDPDRYLERVDSLQRFNRVLEGDQYKLSFGFIDHHGVAHEVTCRISNLDHEREVAAYGYTEAEVSARVDEGLRIYLEQELAERGLKQYVRFHVNNGAVRAESRLPPAQEGQDVSLSAAGLNNFFALLKETIPKKREALMEEILTERGLWLHENAIYPDYPQIASRATGPLAECFRALEQAGSGYNDRQYLGLFIAFFQEIRYELPPEVLDGKATLGLWVPTEVLVNNHGDCDSKAAAFGALWRKFGSPILVIMVPGHVLVGVPVRPGPGDQHLLIHNRYYLLAEVAGPGKARPGTAGDTSLAHLSGHFLYRLIPAADP